MLQAPDKRSPGWPGTGWSGSRAALWRGDPRGRLFGARTKAAKTRLPASILWISPSIVIQWQSFNYVWTRANGAHLFGNFENKRPKTVLADICSWRRFTTKCPGPLCREPTSRDNVSKNAGSNQGFSGFLALGDPNKMLKISEKWANNLEGMLYCDWWHQRCLY